MKYSTALRRMVGSAKIWWSVATPGIMRILTLADWGPFAVAGLHIRSVVSTPSEAVTCIIFAGGTLSAM